MVERGLLQERAYSEIKGLIQDGTFSTGSFLSERQLAAQLGMSKTPIRTALVRLDIEGFVAVSPQQGIVVREPSLQEIVDLFDIRVAIETYVVRRLAGKLSADQKAELRINLRGQADAARLDDDVALTELDTEFHVLLCGFAGNVEIGRVISNLRDKLHRIILRVMRQAEGRPRSAVAEHAAIAEALFRGRGEDAAERIRKHLEFGKQFLVAP